MHRSMHANNHCWIGGTDVPAKQTPPILQSIYYTVYKYLCVDRMELHPYACLRTFKHGDKKYNFKSILLRTRFKCLEHLQGILGLEAALLREQNAGEQKALSSPHLNHQIETLFRRRETPEQNLGLPRDVQAPEEHPNS